MKMIYLDYAATTPIDPQVAANMSTYLTDPELFGNSASLHCFGDKARQAIEHARAQVADYLHALPEEIVFTSGATEAINLAIKGTAALLAAKGKHIITLKTEHKATLDTCQFLEKQGHPVTYLTPQQNGLLDFAELVAAIRSDTILISITHANNETGIIQDLSRLAELAAQHKILLHIDAAQTPGKLLLNVQETPVDLISLCAHKVYGPKGIGALYLRKRPRVRLVPLLHGGGHEQGLRSGTLATHQIVGFGEALRLAKENLNNDCHKISEFRAQFLQGLASIKNLELNTEATTTVPHIISVRFNNMLADEILRQLPIAASTASACQGKSIEGSHVLRAMGLTTDQIKSSIRFSFGRFTTTEEIDQTVNAIKGLFV